MIQCNNDLALAVVSNKKYILLHSVEWIRKAAIGKPLLTK